MRYKEAEQEGVGMFGRDPEGRKRRARKVTQVHRHGSRGAALNRGGEYMAIFRIAGQRGD